MERPFTHTTFEDLKRAAPEEVVGRALVAWDAGPQCYSWPSLGRPFSIAAGGEILEYGGFLPSGKARRFLPTIARLYLLGCRDLPRAGEWVLPYQLSGARSFFSGGSHTLPVDRLAQRCDAVPGFLLSAGKTLGGRVAALPDEAVELRPFPRLPVALAYHPGEPGDLGRAQLLFDSTAAEHLPIDSLWALALLILETVESFV